MFQLLMGTYFSNWKWYLKLSLEFSDWDTFQYFCADVVPIQLFHKWYFKPSLEFSDWDTFQYFCADVVPIQLFHKWYFKPSLEFSDWDTFQYFCADMFPIQLIPKAIFNRQLIWLDSNHIIHILLIWTHFSTYVLIWFKSRHSHCKTFTITGIPPM